METLDQKILNHLSTESWWARAKSVAHTLGASAGITLTLMSYTADLPELRNFTVPAMLYFAYDVISNSVRSKRAQELYIAYNHPELSCNPFSYNSEE